MSVFNFFPEGWKNDEIENTKGILQGIVTNCDEHCNLYVELSNGKRGIIKSDLFQKEYRLRCLLYGN